MITTPTTFILGAGASKPYGYPLGAELLEQIQQGGFAVREALQQFGFARPKVNDFCESLLWSGLDSIDAYLSRAERHLQIGKLALAHMMLTHDERGANFSADWLGYIWRQLIRGVTKPEEFAKNHLSIVTFNYDTVIERFLTNALKYTFDISLTDAIQIASAVRIVHVYGKLPTTQGEHRLEPISCTKENTERAAQGLIVLHEGKDDSSEFRLARELLLQAKLRVFLGFGYLEDNMRRLRLTDWVVADTNTPLGTGFQMTPAECQLVQRMFPAGYSLTWLPGRCLEGVRAIVSQFNA